VVVCAHAEVATAKTIIESVTRIDVRIDCPSKFIVVQTSSGGTRCNVDTSHDDSHHGMSLPTLSGSTRKFDIEK